MFRVLHRLTTLRGQLLLCALVAPLLSATPSAAAPGSGTGSCPDDRIRLEPLGTLGGAQSTASAINDRGRIVGGSSTPDGAYHAFLWEDGDLTDLTPTEYASSDARDVNDRGQILINAYAEGTGEQAILVWDEGTLTRLPIAPGYLSVDPAAIGDDGTVVGTAGAQAGPPFLVAVVWRDGAMSVLPPPVPGVEYGATGINDSGQISGYVQHGPGGMMQAVVWDSDGSVRDLGALAPVYSQAQDLNDRGEVVGWYKPTAVPGDAPFLYPSRPILWRGDSAIDLGTLAGDSGSGGAMAINARGQVVGTSSVAPLASNQAHAFLWQDGQLLDINDGALGSVANDINDAGVIVGWADLAPGEPPQAVRWRLRKAPAPAEAIASLDAKVSTLETRKLIHHGKSASLLAKLAAAQRKLGHGKESHVALHLQTFEAEAASVLPLLPDSESAEFSELLQAAACQPE